jgi:hypothetical protein
MWQPVFKEKNRDNGRHGNDSPMRAKKKFFSQMKGILLSEEDAFKLGLDIEADCICLPRKICSIKRTMKKFRTLPGNSIKMNSFLKKTRLVLSYS